MTTHLPPDYEDRHTLALALCQHLDIDPQHVALGSMQIELGPDHKHRVTWTGTAVLNLNDLTELLIQANALHEDDHRSEAMRRDLAPHPDEIEIGDTGYQGRRTRYDYPPT